jgi:hypothetical protein
VRNMAHSEKRSLLRPLNPEDEGRWVGSVARARLSRALCVLLRSLEFALKGVGSHCRVSKNVRKSNTHFGKLTGSRTYRMIRRRARGTAENQSGDCVLTKKEMAGL